MSEGKFGFTSEEAPPEKDLALQFQPTPVSRKNLAIEEVDRVAEAAGFSSRERGPAAAAPRRRRSLAHPPSRHLAIRMPEAVFNRFLRYADRHQLTYSDVIVRLLDAAKEP